MLWLMLIFATLAGFTQCIQDKIHINPEIFSARDGKLIKNKITVSEPKILVIFYQTGKKVSLDLELTPEILPKVYYQGKDSKLIAYNSNFTNSCHYQGKVKTADDSFASVSICDGIEGIFSDGGNFYEIHHENSGNHYIKALPNFGLNQLKVENGTKMDENFRRRLVKRQVRGTYNSNDDPYYLELCIVVDNRVSTSYDHNIKSIQSFLIEVVNIMNLAYNQLNISIALTSIVLWNEHDQIELSSDHDLTLSNFRDYRRKILLNEIPNDSALLLTYQRFQGEVMGHAYQEAICYRKVSCGIVSYISQLKMLASLMAHEIGHNFGMKHDSEGCECKTGNCIMSDKYSEEPGLYWSSCSIHDIKTHLELAKPKCLKNKPKSLLTHPLCGNGFVEAGEECDCGFPEYCTSNCCDARTCKLFRNATCATGECCDLNSCQLKEAGSPCRKVKSDCDLPEYCTGNDEYCPEDLKKIDAESCANGNGYCFKGSCETRDDHCRTYWGPESFSVQSCYLSNEFGSIYSNCGRESEKFIQCKGIDRECGMLQCKKIDQIRHQEDFEPMAAKNPDNDCHIVFEDHHYLKNDYSHPVYVKNGVKCDTNRMCFDRECLSIVELRETGKIQQRKSDCNGNGVNSNNGYCVCNSGYLPPNCTAPDPRNKTKVNNSSDNLLDYFMYFFSVLILLMIILLLILVFYKKE